MSLGLTRRPKGFVPMHGISNSTMSKAAGRAGRLAEAMTLVRRVLAETRQAGVAADGVRASTVASDSGNVQSLGHGSAFTTSLLGARWPKDGFAKESSGGSAGIEMPDAMRGFLDQVGQLGSLPGMSGLGSSLAKAPAASLPAGARFEEYLYSNAAGTRAYKLYVPSGYNDQQSLPLVVMMHGCTQSPDDFAAGTRMNELAEEQMFLVAYPAQSQSANVSKCWNWFNASDQQRDTGEPSLIAGKRARSCRTSPSIPNASTSQDFPQGAQQPPSWDQSTRTSTRPLASILDWRAALPSTCPLPSPQCGRAGYFGRTDRSNSAVYHVRCRPSSSMATGTRQCTRRTASRSSRNPKAKPSSIARSARANRLAEWPIRAQSRRIRPGSPSSSIGCCTEPATLGRAEVQPAPIRCHAGRMPVVRCCASSSITQTLLRRRFRGRQSR
jgi:hypothetical protein